MVNKPKAKKKGVTLMGYDVFKFGALHLDGVIQHIPQNPRSNGDIPRYNEQSAISIGKAGQKGSITWIKPHGCNILVADRALLVNVSCKKLKENGFVDGNEIQVKGQNFLCRLLRLGTNSDADNEWSRILDMTSVDNDLWHWAEMFFWGSDAFHGMGTLVYYPVRGYHAPTKWNYLIGAGNDEFIGFRPALEPLGAVRPFSNWVLDGEQFQLDYIPGGDGFCPILQPAQKSVFTGIPDDSHVRMYTFMEGGHPIPIGEPIRYNSHLTLTDCYFGDEYLVPWTISNGVAVASQSFQKKPQ